MTSDWTHFLGPLGDATDANSMASATPPPDAAANAYAAAAAADPSLPTIYPKPVTVLVIGMAGSGKTTLMQRLAVYGVDAGLRNYVINLDPAVRKTGYTANIDIRDTVDYKQVMKEYGLGPNGAIMTSLNLFATRFDQVVDLLAKRSSDLEYVRSFLLQLITLRRMTRAARANKWCSCLTPLFLSFALASQLCSRRHARAN